MRLPSLLVVLPGLALAQPAEDVPAGTWTGTLTPMNHPDLHTPLVYEVGHEADGLTLALGPAEADVQVRAEDVRLDADALHFWFREPDAAVRLDCEFRRRDDGSYAGRCTDADGKYATLTMRPPTPEE
ncbi:MAG: hypothetical protein R3362_09815 [Rhodothermales bacterium]|nr:hypothetical protein [Rhodothermales bacterium]